MQPAATERHHVSWEAWNFMRHEIARLQAENAQLRGDVAYWEQQANHWYMKANYSEVELAMFARRRSRGLDEATGEWVPDARQNVA